MSLTPAFIMNGLLKNPRWSKEIHMNKIINGRKYDTATAKEIYESSSQSVRGMTLYQKKTGEFFLFCWDSFGSRSIQPMTEERAKEWLADFASADEYEKVFGPVKE